jgi:hypothetical protein
MEVTATVVSPLLSRENLVLLLPSELTWVADPETRLRLTQHSAIGGAKAFW